MKDLPNVFIVVMDTLRKSVLPVYGGTAESPNITNFAGDSVVFPKPVSPSSWTVPSHFSMFTGLYPREHHVHEDSTGGLVSTPAKIFDYTGFHIIKYLRDKGYTTLGMSANPVLHPASGFDSHFSQYTVVPNDYNFSFKTADVKTFKKYDKNLQIAALKMISRGKISELMEYYRSYQYIHNIWKATGFPSIKGSDVLFDFAMNTSLEQPFFMFMNVYDVHEPVCKFDLYNTPLLELLDLIGNKIIKEGQMKKIRESYMNSARRMDEQFGRFISYLKKSGLYENSLIILTSDHGQSLKEPEEFPYYGHGTFLYDSLIEVPLIVKYPRNVKFEVNEGYQSLTSIPEIIKNVLEDDKIKDPTRSVVFSESWGYMNNIKTMIGEYQELSNVDFEEFISKIGYPRKSVYSNGFKLTVDGKRGKIVEFKKDGKPVSVDKNHGTVSSMIEELEIFKGMDSFNLPILK